MQKLRLVHDGGPILNPQNMKEMAKVLVAKFIHRISTPIKLVDSQRAEIKKIKIIEEVLNEETRESWIDSIKTEDQLEENRQYLERSIDRGHITPESYSHLHKTLKKRLRHITNEKNEQIRTLPHLMKRQAALEEMLCNKGCGHKMKEHVLVGDSIICPSSAKE